VQFARALRDRVRSGEITTSVRLWQGPKVRVGGRYSLPPGEIVVTKLSEISLGDVTPEMGRLSGFSGIVELLKVAKHGAGRRVFFVEFRYSPKRAARPGPPPNKSLKRTRER
jgi:hypothetical protein